MVSADILLPIAAVVPLLVLIVQFGILRRLGRIERALAVREASPAPSAVEEDAGDTSAAGSGHFETFLSEDPARREWTKSEQFAAYRKWRAEKGLNWKRP